MDSIISHPGGGRKPLARETHSRRGPPYARMWTRAGGTRRTTPEAKPASLTQGSASARVSTTGMRSWTPSMLPFAEVVSMTHFSCPAKSFHSPAR